MPLEQLSAFDLLEGPERIIDMARETARAVSPVRLPLTLMGLLLAWARIPPAPTELLASWQASWPP